MVGQVPNRELPMLIVVHVRDLAGERVASVHVQAIYSSTLVSTSETLLAFMTGKRKYFQIIAAANT